MTIDEKTAKRIFRSIEFTRSESKSSTWTEDATFCILMPPNTTLRLICAQTFRTLGYTKNTLLEDAVGHVSANWSHLWAQYMPKRALKTTHYYLIKWNWCNREPKAWKSDCEWNRNAPKWPWKTLHEMQLSFLPFRIPFTCSDSVSLCTRLLDKNPTPASVTSKGRNGHANGLRRISLSQKTTQMLWFVFVFTIQSIRVQFHSPASA